MSIAISFRLSIHTLRRFLEIQHHGRAEPAFAKLVVAVPRAVELFSLKVELGTVGEWAGAEQHSEADATVRDGLHLLIDDFRYTPRRKAPVSDKSLNHQTPGARHATWLNDQYLIRTHDRPIWRWTVLLCC
jgi:hypothetical protein